MGPPHATLAVLAASILLASASAHYSHSDTPLLPRTERQETCVESMFAATPSQVEGPFYFTAPVRADITENRPGAPLSLTLAVRDHNCEPFPAGTRVSVWHTDASGVYSGFVTRPDAKTEIDSRGERFFRGELPTDEEGKVKFSTIVPGWYTNRPVHIHVKVIYADKELTTQLYFKEDLIKEVGELESYVSRGDPDTTNEDEDVASSLILAVNRVKDGYAAEYSLGVDIDASSLSPAGSNNEAEDAGSSAANTGENDSTSNDCFDESAEVLLESGVIKRMADLNVGDRVLVAPDTFSDVFAFTHRTRNVFKDFITFYLSSGATLSVTPGHFVFADSELVVASAVRPGATFETGTGRKAVVERVETRTLSGLYNPQTLHGNIVVNNVVVSTYTSALQPLLAHGALGIARCGYRFCGGLDFTFRALESGGWSFLATLARTLYLHG